VFVDTFPVIQNVSQNTRDNFSWMKRPMFLLVEYVITYNLKHNRIIMKYPIPREISEYFLYSSFLILIAAIITFYNKDYLTSFIIFCLFFTSINFWRNPLYNIHRTLDMTMCKILATFFIISSFTFCECNRVLFDCALLVCLIYNIIENILWIFDSNKWVIFHLAIHIYVFYFIIFIYYIL